MGNSNAYDQSDIMSISKLYQISGYPCVWRLGRNILCKKISICQQDVGFLEGTDISIAHALSLHPQTVPAGGRAEHRKIQNTSVVHGDTQISTDALLGARLTEVKRCGDTGDVSPLNGSKRKQPVSDPKQPSAALSTILLDLLNALNLTPSLSTLFVSPQSSPSPAAISHWESSPGMRAEWACSDNDPHLAMWNKVERS